MNRSYSKIRHIQESNNRLENRLLNEQSATQQNTKPEQNIKTITNKVATEGIKNVLPEMISSPQFKGQQIGYGFGGVFNGVMYEWDCMGVEGMVGIRGMVDGEIISETAKNMFTSLKIPLTDAKLESPSVGFYSKGNTSFVIYTTTQGKPKCITF
jgi:hypothetical protein